MQFWDVQALTFAEAHMKKNYFSYVINTKVIVCLNTHLQWAILG